MRRCRIPTAFTLVELLVVIGVIAVLIGMLMPALSRARSSAQTAACLSNLRQLAVAAQSYAVNYKGYYPPAFWEQPPDATQYNWDFTIRPDKTVVPGLLWSGQTNVQVQQCPVFTGRSNAAGTRYSGYNYNTSYIGRGRSLFSVEGPPAKVGQVRRPAETVIFGDGEWANGANKFMRSPKPSPSEDPITFAVGSPGRIAGTQGFRHGRKTNVAFCDGHAVTLSDRFARAGVTELTGYLSEDNSLYDLK